jgi:uncharacterized iron-regulated membrane protein
MKEGFRQAMSWLHTWSGLVLGWLLFAIFLTGTLAFFRAELDLWSRPELYPPGAPAPDAAVRAQQALHAHAPGVTQWIMRLPDERMPAVTLLWRDRANGRFQTLLMDPATGAVREGRDSMGGEFFYRFHFELRHAKVTRFALEARWVVGVATLAMFVALLTGIVTHRRIFKDFFTFRPGKGGQRAWMDAHNVVGVLVLPFYLMITFSGLMIFHTQYLPAGIAALYRSPAGIDSQAYFAEVQGDPAERSGRPRPGGAPLAPLPIAPLAPMLAQARAEWPEGRIGGLQMGRRADGSVQVEITRHDGDRLQYRPPRLVFDAADGRLLHRIDAEGPATRTYGVLYGLHMARFADPGLRWALFGFGLAGSAMIATGLVLWVVKRRARQGGRWGLRVVETLNAAAIAGLPLAIAMFFWANRQVPAGLPARADAELQCFFLSWAASLALAAALPGRAAWRALLGLGGAAFAGLPLLNALTTGAHLGRTLVDGHWAWAAVDLSFLAMGLLMGWLALRLAPAERAEPRTVAPTAAAEG